MALDIPALLGELTPEEKASLCSGADFWHTKAVERLGIPSIMVTDGPHGLRKQATDADNLGIGNSVPATCFPTAAALGSSWDTDLLRRVGEALGAEARAEQVAVLLGPGVNIKRSPLCGRNFEYFAEDPLLAGELGAALAQGVQSQGVGVSLKHFAANNQETDRMWVSAEVDERTLREIYLPAFERVVKTAAPWTVMCSYNRVNGRYASENPWLLTEVLRDEWGFNGLVVSDWGAVNVRTDALAAGLDLEMPATGGHTDAQIVDAVRAGQLEEAMLDRAVERVLTLIQRTAVALADPGTADHDAHHVLARQVATECAVLLKNEADLLPLDPAAGPIAVVGELARSPRYQGAGSSQVNPTRLDDALTELQNLGADVRFAAGYLLDGVQQPDSAQQDERLQAEAIEVARDTDTVVLFLGLPASAESEGFDREHIRLPDNQLALLDAVAEVADRIVVVLSNGSVVQTSTWEQRADAILESWLPGQGGGGAVADLLLGRAVPSGRLAETIPIRLEHCAAQLNFPGEAGTVRYGEGLFVGYRGYDQQAMSVSYPFGHGLSYTTFNYTDLAVSVEGSGADTRVQVTASVTNTGARAGREVVQLYLSDPESSCVRPVRELKAFTKITIGPGASQTVRFTLDARDLSYFHPITRQWTLEGGEFEVAVGASSRDLRLTDTITVEAPELVPPLTVDSSVVEWASHPTGGPLLRDALGDGAEALLGKESLDLMGSMPLRRAASFPTMPLDPDGYQRLAAAAVQAGAGTFGDRV